MSKSTLLRQASLAVLASGLVIGATAQEAETSADNELRAQTITVTATRRAESVQDIPLNIAAVGDTQIEEQGFDELSDVLAYVPGINVVDRGGRQGNPIIVRGLNADGLGSGDGNNDGGGTVATYLGEIPVFVDLKLNDLERVEVLLGPQGTLYGAGTLGGAIRYIPKKPDFDGDMVNVRAELSQNFEADIPSYETGFTFNKALAPNFAIRGSFDIEDDSGFTDYPFVVRDIGVSDADPDFTDPSDVAANLRRIKDADGEQVISGRIAARWEPLSWLDGTLTYYYQESDIEGRRISSARSTVPAGDYESGKRVEEPNEITNQLLALEIVADLGFAELTSATGVSRYDDVGQRDQTDLLISLEYSYELFPTFTAFTAEKGKQDRINQEIRLVSTTDSRFNWIVGAFYNEFEEVARSIEYTPGYSEYLGEVPGADLEYFEKYFATLEEAAFFGEVGFDITDKWTVTVGGRYYEYERETYTGFDFPIGDDTYVPIGISGLEAFLKADVAGGGLGGTEKTEQSDNGTLFKFNTAYEVTDDLLVYLTVSEGYRIGDSNGIAPCPDFDPLDTEQKECALAPGQQFGPNPGDVSTRDEIAFGPDTTTNYEIGFKSVFADGRVTLNAAAFFVEWTDPQLSSSTINASIPITVNAEGAESKGIELNGNWIVTDGLTLRGSYSHTEASLTAPAPGLVATIDPPGFGSVLIDGADGDRLPGSPEDQFSVFASYMMPNTGIDGNLIFNFGYAWQSDVLTRTGSRGGGITLDAFGVANASAVLEKDSWTATLFVNNLFNEYYETGAVVTPLYNQVLMDDDGGPVNVRSYYTHIGAPRTMGIRFSYTFE